MKDWLRGVALFVNHVVLRRIYGMQISPSARVSLRARLDRTNPRGISIGDESFVAAGAVVLAHDFVRGLHAPTRIGRRCFIGVNAVILPGVEVGDHSVVGAGAIVTESVPAGSIVAGNPARVIKTGVRTLRFGRLEV